MDGETDHSVDVPKINDENNKVAAKISVRTDLWLKEEPSEEKTPFNENQTTETVYNLTSDLNNMYIDNGNRNLINHHSENKLEPLTDQKQTTNTFVNAIPSAGKFNLNSNENATNINAEDLNPEPKNQLSNEGTINKQRLVKYTKFVRKRRHNSDETTIDQNSDISQAHILEMNNSFIKNHPCFPELPSENENPAVIIQKAYETVNRELGDHCRQAAIVNVREDRCIPKLLTRRALGIGPLKNLPSMERHQGELHLLPVREFSTSMQICDYNLFDKSEVSALSPNQEMFNSIPIGIQGILPSSNTKENQNDNVQFPVDSKSQPISPCGSILTDKTNHTMFDKSINKGIPDFSNRQNPNTNLQSAADSSHSTCRFLDNRLQQSMTNLTKPDNSTTSNQNTIESIDDENGITMEVDY